MLIAENLKYVGTFSEKNKLKIDSFCRMKWIPDTNQNLYVE